MTAIKFPGYCEVLGSEVLYEQGCFSNVAYYLRGIHREQEVLAMGHVTFVNGHTGPETRVLVSQISIGIRKVLAAAA